MEDLSLRTCAALVRALRWPDGPVCPYCSEGSPALSQGPLSCKRPYRGHLTYLRCRRCRRFFSELTGTVMEHSKVDLPTWFFLIDGIDRGTCIRHLALRTRYSRQACARTAHLIRQSRLCARIRALLRPPSIPPKGGEA